MSWRDAPLYIESRDLAVWLLERCRTETEGTSSHLGSPIHLAATELVTSIALALTFPLTRAEHLEAADRTVVRLRELLRLAEATRELTPRQLRFAETRLMVAGRMIGGWKRRREQTEN